MVRTNKSPIQTTTSRFSILSIFASGLGGLGVGFAYTHNFVIASIAVAGGLAAGVARSYLLTRFA